MFPLHIQGNVIGAIVFAHTQQAFLLTDQDLKRIQRYVSQVATCIQNARLYEQSLLNQHEIKVQKQMLNELSNKISKYIPPQVYDSIIAGQQKVKLGSSRKKLTIFFSDIVDFTELTNWVESEELTELINDYLDQMSKIALRYGATIDKYIGDAIMIFFGAPESKGEKEDALACVLMALEMREHMKHLQNRWEREGIRKPLHVWKGMSRNDKLKEKERMAKPLQIRMGIHTGFCSVGNFGSDDRLNYTILGGQVNLANRLESSAEADEILISHETFALVQDKIACEKKKIIKVKGFAYPIQTYQVLEYRENLTRKQEPLQEEGTGYSISIQYDELAEDEKDHVINFLEMAIKNIKQSQ